MAHLNFWRSDHRPIVLRAQAGAWDGGRPFRRKRFHFEECWIDEPACRNLVVDCWSGNNDRNAVGSLISKIQRCGIKLEVWNNQCRRRLKEVIVNKRMELKSAYDNVCNGSWRDVQNIEAQLDSM